MPAILVTNPKGGSGKTTLAINLAGYFACRDEPVVLWTSTVNDRRSTG